MSMSKRKRKGGVSGPTPRPKREPHPARGEVFSKHFWKSQTQARGIGIKGGRPTGGSGGGSD